MTNPHPIPPMPIRASPYQHQQAAYALALKLFGLYGNGVQSPGVAVLMEMGTGKTLVAVGITGTAYLDGAVDNVLVVAPKSILGVWRDEFLKFADFDYDLAILTKSSENKARTLAGMTGKCLQIAVVNYESVWRIEPAIQAWRPDMVIADEAHKIKTHNASVSRAMHRIGAAARFKSYNSAEMQINERYDIISARW